MSFYGLKARYREELNIRAFLETYGVGPSGCSHLALTFKDNVTDKKEASKYWNKLRTMLSSTRYQRLAFGSGSSLIGSVLHFILVWERQGRGAWHLHVITFFKGVSNTKFRKLLNLCISRMNSPFGFYKLIRTHGDPMGVTLYLGKYLVKWREKGVRLVSYSRRFQRVCSSVFSFSGGKSGSWRESCQGIFSIFPCFKSIYSELSFDHKLHVVGLFDDGYFLEIKDFLLKYFDGLSPLIRMEWDVFVDTPLFSCELK